MREERSPLLLAGGLFGLFVLFLYGPMIVIFVLSFQDQISGLTFPMNGVSLHSFERLWNSGGIVDVARCFGALAQAWAHRDGSHRAPVAERLARVPQAVSGAGAPVLRRGKES